jgi:uncharacterized membrane protein
MKILLINANPVVGKLVTLSAQKTGDELTTASSIEELEPQSYDLVMMDDNAYTQELFEELKSKVSFSQSCFIGSRTSEKPEEFSREFNKPFLPTDLVDIFMEISSAMTVEPEAMEKPDLAEDEFDFDVLLNEPEEADNKEPSLGDALENLDDLEDIDEELDEELEEEPEESLDLQKSVLDEDDVNEVKGLLEEEDETEEEDLAELDDLTPPYRADEKVLNEINEALDELDEENEDEADTDNVPDELSETEEELTEEDLEGLFDDLEDEESEESLDEKNDEDMSDEPALNEALPEEIDGEFGEEPQAEDAEDELTDLDDEMDEEISKSFMTEEETAQESLSDDELDRMIEEMESDEEDVDAQEDLSALTDTLENEELTPANTQDEQSDALSDSDEIDEIDLEDEASADGKKADVEEEELDELDALDEFDELLDETDEPDTLDEAPTEEENLEEDLPDTLEEAEEKGEEEIDLSALSEEIEAALGELDDDDLLDELDEEEMEGFENDFSSISANDLKIALGEEVLEEPEADEEELEIQKELDALEFMDEEDEEEPELLVGQGEFASLHEEALNEAMGERNESDNEHPELDEIDAFVDQIPIEGVSAEETSIESLGDASVAALEKLIATLKQDNVKEALKGMDMNIKISFSEKVK